MLSQNNLRKGDLALDFAVALLLGLVFTQVILGLDKLNPSFTDWILIPGGDTSYHYLAWEYFKDGPWTWPLGRIEGYAYPMYNSVMYTDSIPLLAFIFKSIRFLLPDDFQYFGLWHASCYVLNAWLGIKLSRQLGWSTWMSWLITPLYTGAVVLVARFGHTALCAQWVILYALLIFLQRNERSVKDIYFRLGTLVFVTSLIHPYLLFMVLGVVAASPFQLKYQRSIGWASMFGFLFTSIALALFGWYSSGAFLFKGQLSEGLGRYSANLNSLINAWDVGRLGLSFNYYGDGQGEGIAYLGLGVIILGILLICYTGYQRLAVKPIQERKTKLTLNWFFIISILFFVFALSPKWTLGNHVLIDWKYNDYVSRTFRGTGRFIWPLHYFILYWVSHKLFQMPWKTWILALILSGIVIIQALDLSPLWKRKPYIDEKFNNLPYIDQFKSLIARSDKVIVYPPYTASIATYCDYIYFVDIAQKFRKPITAGYGARFPVHIGNAFRDSLNDLTGYLKNHGQDILLTHVDSLRLHQELLKALGGRSYQFDRYRVFVPDKLGIKSADVMIDSMTWQLVSRSIPLSLKDYLTTHPDLYLCGVVQQEATLGMRQETKDFLKAGGAIIDSIGFGTSWTFVWHGGKIIQQKFSNNDLALDNLTLPGCMQESIQVNMVSGGHKADKNESSIKVNGIEYSALRRGVNIALIDQCGRVIEQVNVDSYVSDGFVVKW